MRFVPPDPPIPPQYVKKIDLTKITNMMQESNLNLRREQLMKTVNLDTEADHPLKGQLGKGGADPAGEESP